LLYILLDVLNIKNLPPSGPFRENEKSLDASKGLRTFGAMNSATKPKPPIIDADFDEAMRGLMAVKPPPSGKNTKVTKNKRRATKT
jgi:hypothetical protein